MTHLHKAFCHISKAESVAQRSLKQVATSVCGLLGCGGEHQVTASWETAGPRKHTYAALILVY
jgi:hypothetical protein